MIQGNKFPEKIITLAGKSFEKSRHKKDTCYR